MMWANIQLDILFQKEGQQVELQQQQQKERVKEKGNPIAYLNENRGDVFYRPIERETFVLLPRSRSTKDMWLHLCIISFNTTWLINKALEG